MTKDDRNKLIKAGFTILRVYETPTLCIKQMTAKDNWTIAYKFETKAAMNREIARINEHQPKLIFE